MYSNTDVSTDGKPYIGLHGSMFSLYYTASTIRFFWLKLLPWELDINGTNLTLLMLNTIGKQFMDGISI